MHPLTSDLRSRPLKLLLKHKFRNFAARASLRLSVALMFISSLLSTMANGTTLDTQLSYPTSSAHISHTNAPLGVTTASLAPAPPPCVTVIERPEKVAMIVMAHSLDTDAGSRAHCSSRTKPAAVQHYVCSTVCGRSGMSTDVFSGKV